MRCRKTSAHSALLWQISLVPIPLQLSSFGDSSPQVRLPLANPAGYKDILRVVECGNIDVTGRKEAGRKLASCVAFSWCDRKMQHKPSADKEIQAMLHAVRCSELEKRPHLGTGVIGETYHVLL